MSGDLNDGRDAGEAYRDLCREIDAISDRARDAGDLDMGVVSEQFFYVACKLILEESKDMGTEWRAEWCHGQIRFLENSFAEDKALMGYLQRDDADLDMLREQIAEQKKALKATGWEE